MKFGKGQRSTDQAGWFWCGWPVKRLSGREAIEEVPYRAFAEMRYNGRFGYVRIVQGTAID